MAELLRARPEARLEFNGVKIECKADGTLLLFVPPEAFKVMMQAGSQGGGQSGRLYTQVIIAPMLPDPASASRPTQTGL